MLDSFIERHRVLSRCCKGEVNLSEFRAINQKEHHHPWGSMARFWALRRRYHRNPNCEGNNEKKCSASLRGRKKSPFSTPRTQTQMTGSCPHMGRASSLILSTRELKRNKNHFPSGVFAPGILCCCSVARSYPTLCHSMDCNTPGFPVLHLRELA